MHVALVCPEIPGHLNPLTTLGRELAARGMRVSLMGMPTAQAKAEKAGLGFVSFGEAEHADGSVAATIARVGELSGFSGMRETGKLLSQLASITLRDAPGAVRRAGIDALVVDQFSPAGAVVAARLGVPYVIACDAIAATLDPHVVPGALGLRHREGWIWRRRNWLAGQVVKRIFQWVGSGPGVPNPLMLLDHAGQELAYVAQQPAWFEYPRPNLPGHFHYTAPWHRPDRDADVAFPWEKLDGRQLVYASLGTLQNKVKSVYGAIAAAAEGLDVQMVLALGDREATADFRVPENVIVTPFAPQLRLLERASAAVTHAGLNTALECLAHGVPMVCLPVTNDQPGVAARVAWLGAGEVLKPGRATRERIREALRRVLREPGRREAVRKCRARLRSVDGVTAAADVVEKAFTTGQRVERNGASWGRKEAPAPTRAGRLTPVS